MPVAINYKICDLAPMCGGIEVCPTGAFFWNKKTKRPDVDNKKCLSCGVCVRECPVNAILLARDQKEYDELLEKIKNDPRSEVDLWKEKLGTQPGRTVPLAPIITTRNFQEEISGSKDWILLDVWSEETLDCRFHSISFDDLKLNKVSFKKLDGGTEKELAYQLRVKKPPTLILFKDGRERWRHEGYLYASDRNSIKQELEKLIS